MSLCIVFCSFSNSLVNVFADVQPDFSDDYFSKIYVSGYENVDFPGSYYYQPNLNFVSCDYETQSYHLSRFISDKYWAVLNYGSSSKDDYLIFISDYKFKILYDSSKFKDIVCFSFYDEDFGSFKPFQYASIGYVSHYLVINGTKPIFNLGVASNLFYWKIDDFRKSLSGDTSVNPFCINSNFDLRFEENGDTVSIFNPEPDHGTGTFKVTLNFDPKKFRDVKCLQYPNDEIKSGDTFGYVAGDKFGFEWKYDGRVCYAEYGPNVDGDYEKLKPYKRDDNVIGIQGKFANGHDRTITLKEGSGEWYDIIFDFLESLFNGIYIFFKPILDFFANIFDFLWNLIVDVFKFIFVPEEGFFEKFFNESMELINRKLGILIYPFTLVIDVLSRFLNLPNASSSLMIPAINIFDVTVFGGVKYDLLGIINADSRFKNLYNIYLSFVDVILIFAVVNLSRRTFSSNFKKGADVS